MGWVVLARVIMLFHALLVADPRWMLLKRELVIVPRGLLLVGKVPLRHRRRSLPVPLVTSLLIEVGLLRLLLLSGLIVLGQRKQRFLGRLGLIVGVHDAGLGR